MKIVINGRFLGQQITGVQRYATEVISAMDCLLPEYPMLSMELVYPKNNIEKKLYLKNIKTKSLGILKGHLWEQIELPLYARNVPLLSLCGSAPVFHYRSINIIHDCAIYAAPEAFSKLFLFWYRLIHPWLAKNAVVLGTVSHFSASEIERYFGISKENIHVLPNGTEHIHRTKPDLTCLDRFNLVPHHYVVAVLSKQQNKNIDQIIRISDYLKKQYNLNSVLIGGGAKCLAFSQVATQKSSVIFTGYLSDSEMTGLIRQSLCLLFPSRYEGFGIPPLEAMALEIPVITSNAASLTEVCGNAALYFNFDDDNGLLQNIDTLINNSTLRKELQIKGLKNIERFLWRETAEKILHILTQQGTISNAKQ